MKLFPVIVVISVIGAIGVIAYLEMRKRKSSDTGAITPPQPQVIPSQVIYSYHPPPYSPGSDFQVYGSNTGIFNAFSPYNVYGIPTGLVQQNPVTRHLFGTGPTVYYYSGDRVPDFLLSPQQFLNMDQTRLYESYWPASRYGDPLIAG